MKRRIARWWMIAALGAGLLGPAAPPALAQPESTGSVAAEEKEACVKNLKTIYAAIQAYQLDHRELPNWLSDLVPKYLPDPGVLICPVCRRTGKAEDNELADPNIPSSYLFEFCPIYVATGNPNGPRRTRREWKRRQMGMLGSVVPVVRCRHHDRILNLAFDGSIYESGTMWENNFTNRVAAADLTAPALFQEDAGPRPAPRRRYPARNANAGPEQLDLTKFYNATLNESWLGRTNSDLAGLPRGLQEFAGIQFDVRGIVQVRSLSLTEKRFPAQVTGIPVHQKCKKLHFLHAADFGTPGDAGKQIASYVVHFAGNQARLEIPVVYERDTGDWRELADDPPAADQPKPIWTGSSAGAAAHGEPRLFETTWTNLAPDVEIESIDFVSSMAGPAPFLIAISAEQP